MSIRPKYRVLSTDELNELEKEFVDFLLLNGITADKWVQIKAEDKEAAEDMITLFSDVVLEGVLRKVKFLEYRSRADIKTFQCLDSSMVLVGMKSSNSSVDFTDESFFQNALNHPLEGMQVYTTSKNYSQDREMELYNMIQSGCEISDGKVFKLLSLAL